MSQKFEFKTKMTKNKNGVDVKTTSIIAKNKNNLISYNDITKFIKKLTDNGEDLTNTKIAGNNRLHGMTIKDDDGLFDPDYMKNKPVDVASKLDGFYSIHFLTTIQN